MVELFFSSTSGLTTIFRNKQYLPRLVLILLISAIVQAVATFEFLSYQRLSLKAVSVTLHRQTTLFPSSSSINNNLIILSVICDYTMTCFRSILFHPPRIFMKYIYFSSAARIKSYTIILSCQLQHLFLSDQPI